jgi:soluble lytic murein transglycosylase-like protein
MRDRGAALAAAAVLAALVVEPARAHGSWVVRWGDTLTGIALARGTTAAELARLNGLARPDVLLAGSTLRLPGAPLSSGGHRYTVRRGDTLSAIAARHGTNVSALARANGLRSANVVIAGRHLHIPGRSFSPQISTAASVVNEPWSVRAAIDYWARRYGVDPHLARALAWMESGYQVNLTSSAGAWGMMQVTPAAWAFVEEVLVGAPIARTPEGNVRVGIAYLDQLLHEFGGDETLALAAYYQGAESVRAYGLFPGTRAYVADVLALKRRV